MGKGTRTPASIPRTPQTTGKGLLRVFSLADGGQGQQTSPSILGEAGARASVLPGDLGACRAGEAHEGGCGSTDCASGCKGRGISKVQQGWVRPSQKESTCAESEFPLLTQQRGSKTHLKGLGWEGGRRRY